MQRIIWGARTRLHKSDLHTVEYVLAPCRCTFTAASCFEHQAPARQTEEAQLPVIFSVMYIVAYIYICICIDVAIMFQREMLLLHLCDAVDALVNLQVKGLLAYNQLLMDKMPNSTEAVM